MIHTKILNFDVNIFFCSADFEQFVTTGLSAAATIRGAGNHSQPDHADGNCEDAAALHARDHQPPLRRQGEKWRRRGAPLSNHLGSL
jgi:hypothetical protein